MSKRIKIQTKNNKFMLTVNDIARINKKNRNYFGAFKSDRSKLGSKTIS